MTNSPGILPTAALLGKGLMGIGCGLMVLVPLVVVLFFVIAGSC